ncbi:replication factor A protein 3 [Cladochytrium replicatum]|nr:replication factor A protein 3 [Cladochytrium replicatum]
MAAEGTPRVLSTQLGQHMNRMVLLIGKIVEFEVELRKKAWTLLQTPDEGRVAVHLSQPLPVPEMNFVEVCGKVRADLAIQEFKTIGLGPQFDTKSYTMMVKLAHQHPDVFGWN